MGANFDNIQAQRARYWYERLPYTFYAEALQAGTTEVFDVRNVDTATDGQKMAIFGNFSAPNTAGINYNLRYGRNFQMPLGGLPSNTPTMTSEDGGVRSTKELTLNMVNPSGATPVMQVNYTGAFKTLTVADKVMLNLPLTEAEQALAGSLPNDGSTPYSIRSNLDRVWRSQIISEEVYSYVQNVGTSSFTLQTETADPDEILVLTKLGANATVGNQVSININRDNDENYVSVLADNMTVDNPFDIWVPATSKLVFQVQAVTPQNNVPVWYSILRLRYSDTLKAMFGKLIPKNATQQRIIKQVEAGVIA